MLFYMPICCVHGMSVRIFDHCNEAGFLKVPIPFRFPFETITNDGPPCSPAGGGAGLPFSRPPAGEVGGTTLPKSASRLSPHPPITT